MDNFQIDVTAEGKASLRQVLELAFRHNSPGGMTSYWSEVSFPSQSKCKALVLFWSDEKNQKTPLQKFPSPLDPEGASELVWRWLAAADYGKEPDHDGDNGKGFRACCGAWGKFENLAYSIVGIVPVWAMYGK